MQLSNIDCLIGLKSLPENSVDSVVTDPPYGLSKQDQDDIIKCLTQWLTNNTYDHATTGFMNSKWDSFVPGPEIWKEVYRVLKPGGHMLVFAGTRTQDLMGISLRLAGFEIRDTLQYLYGSGFPKSMSIGIAIDKKERGHPQGSEDPDSPNAGKFKTQATEGKRSEFDAGQHFGAGPGQFMLEPGVIQKRELTGVAKKWEGWGTALKPAYEPVILCRKPCSESTVAGNVLKYGTGALNIDESRIGTSADIPSVQATRQSDYPQSYSGDGAGWGRTRGGLAGDKVDWKPSGGRFPANVLLQHSEECEQIGTKKVKNSSGSVSGKEPSHTGDENTACYGEYDRVPFQAYGDAEGNEEVPVYKCVEDCPISILDKQAGFTKSGAMKHEVSGYSGESTTTFIRGRSGPSNQHGDSGSVSRFFYTSKASKKDRNTCADGKVRESVGNGHPTVKPLKTMRYLVKLITPPNGIVLDPFTGSGTTGVAALMEKFDFIGFEKELAYFQIANKRLTNENE